MQTAEKSENISFKSRNESKWRARANNFRRKRFAFFRSFIATFPRPIRILDVGGTQQFWETMECIDEDLQILLYNIKPLPVKYPNFMNAVGDATNMKEFEDKEFDLVFSNSVIEHVGTFERQRKMAQEIQRTGKSYFVQTPNRYFPIEPHFLFPFFQFLPLNVRTFIVTHFRTPWGFKFHNKEKARHYVSQIRLMTEKEVRILFPDAEIYCEKFLWMTKSFIAYKKETAPQK